MRNLEEVRNDDVTSYRFKVLEETTDSGRLFQSLVMRWLKLNFLTSLVVRCLKKASNDGLWGERIDQDPMPLIILNTCIMSPHLR